MTPASETLKYPLLFLMGALLLFSLPHTADAQRGKTLRLDFEEKRLSAEIDNAPLRAVLDAIKKQKGIRFHTKKGAGSLLNEEISVRFKGLAMEEALGRILAGTNHCLVFRGDRVSRVMLFGKVKKKRYTGRRRIPRPTRRFRRR